MPPVQLFGSCYRRLNRSPLLGSLADPVSGCALINNKLNYITVYIKD